ncbi:hypothetical protein [Campylobacter showae]|nr:hypothetical protein [Campylobacter showae]
MLRLIVLYLNLKSNLQISVSNLTRPDPYLDCAKFNSVVNLKARAQRQI